MAVALRPIGASPAACHSAGRRLAPRAGYLPDCALTGIFSGLFGRDEPEGQKQRSSISDTDNPEFLRAAATSRSGNSRYRSGGGGGSHLLDGRPAATKALCRLARCDLRCVCPRRRSRRRSVELRRIYPRGPIRFGRPDRRFAVAPADNAASVAFIEAG